MSPSPTVERPTPGIIGRPAIGGKDAWFDGSSLSLFLHVLVYVLRHGFLPFSFTPFDSHSILRDAFMHTL